MCFILISLCHIDPLCLVPYYRWCSRGVGTGGPGGGGGAWPPNVRGGGQSIIWIPSKFREPIIGPLGLIFFTLENVSCLLFESAIAGGKKA